MAGSHNVLLLSMSVHLGADVAVLLKLELLSELDSDSRLSDALGRAFFSPVVLGWYRMSWQIGRQLRSTS